MKSPSVARRLAVMRCSRHGEPRERRAAPYLYYLPQGEPGGCKMAGKHIHQGTQFVADSATVLCRLYAALGRQLDERSVLLLYNLLHTCQRFRNYLHVCGYGPAPAQVSSDVTPLLMSSSVARRKAGCVCADMLQRYPAVAHQQSCPTLWQGFDVSQLHIR